MVEPVLVDAIVDEEALAAQQFPHARESPVVGKPPLKCGADEDHLVGITDNGAVNPPKMRCIAQKGVEVRVAHGHDIGDAIMPLEIQGHRPVAEEIGGMGAGDVRQIHLFGDIFGNHRDFFVEENAMYGF